jgi:hypothetical protein
MGCKAFLLCRIRRGGGGSGIKFLFWRAGGGGLARMARKIVGKRSESFGMFVKVLKIS